MQRQLLSVAVTALILLGTACGFRDLPSFFEAPPKAADYYRDQNICPYLSLPLGPAGGMISVWSCNIPYPISYCGVAAPVVYECCPGKIFDGKYTPDKCLMTESVWKTIPEYLSFYGRVNTSALVARVPKIQTAVYSAFLPYDDVWVTANGIDATKQAAGPADPVPHAFALGRTYSVDMKNGLTLQTAAGSQLKVSIYSNNLMFIECRLLVKPDQEARNGLVHYVRGAVMAPASNVYDAILNNADTADFAKQMPAEYKNLLSGTVSGKWYTVFAPKNDAWKKAAAAYDVKLLYQNAIVEKMLCSEAISGRTSKIGPTLLGEFIGADCTKLNVRSVLDSCGKAIAISRPDLMATNGVVQQVDDVLVPLALRPINEALTCISNVYPGLSVTTTVKHWTECGISLDKALSYVLLMPTDEAHEWFKNYRPLAAQYQRFTTDKEYRCNTYRYHVLLLSGKYKSLPDSYWNQIAFETLYQLNGKAVINSNYYVKYREGSQLFFEYAPTYNLSALNFQLGYIYLMKRIITIPEFDRVTVMSQRPSNDLDIIVKLIKDTGYDKELIAAGPHSLFLAPRSRFLKRHFILDLSKDAQIEFLRMHTVRLRAWGDDIGYFSRQTYQYLENLILMETYYFRLAFKRYISGNMYIGNPSISSDLWSLVIEWNLQGWDGIVWIIDYPIVCPPNYCVGKKKTQEEIKLDVDTYVMYAAGCTTMDGVATAKEFFSNSIEISKKNEDKCVVYEMEPRVSYREWAVDS